MKVETDTVFSWKVRRKSGKSSMILSVRSTKLFLLQNLFPFAKFSKAGTDGRMYRRKYVWTTRVKIMTTTGSVCGSAKWIKQVESHQGYGSIELAWIDGLVFASREKRI